MGIRFYCPNGHKLNVKEFQAGRKGICPYCGAKMQIPTESTRQSSKHERKTAAEHAVVDTSMGTGPPDHVDAASPASSPLSQFAVSAAAEESSPVSSSVGPMPGATGPPEAAPPEAGPMQAGGDPSAGSTMVDPLVEAGDVVWYVRPTSGGQFGPAGADVMRTWIAEGRIRADCLVWREGWRDWREASDVFPQLSTGRNDFALEDVSAGDVRATHASGGWAVTRRRSRGMQTAVIIVLLLAVLVLIGVFIVVVSGNSLPGGSRGNASSSVRRSSVCSLFPAVGHSLHLQAHS